MGNNKNLKAFVRYDGSGRVIAGSLVLRKEKPKVGNWHQVQGYECCNVDQVPVVVTISSAFPFSYPDIALQAIGSTHGMYITSLGSNTTVANIDQLVISLNNDFGKVFGQFKNVSGSLIYYPNAEIAELFASRGATSIAAQTFAD